MILSPLWALAIGAIVAPAFFLVAVYLARAGPRRSLGALAAAVAFALANVLWDQAAFRSGWWAYPAFAGTELLWLLYLQAGLVAGGAFGLLGWRVGRRYGVRGLLLFLALCTLWGMIHDYGGSLMMSASNLMVFSPGVTPLVADGLLYASCGAAAQLVLRAVGGPFRADRLARDKAP